MRSRDYGFDMGLYKKYFAEGREECVLFFVYKKQGWQERDEEK